jgi:hypothetical protein
MPTPLSVSNATRKKAGYHVPIEMPPEQKRKPGGKTQPAAEMP